MAECFDNCPRSRKCQYLYDFSQSFGGLFFAELQPMNKTANNRNRLWGNIPVFPGPEENYEKSKKLSSPMHYKDKVFK